MAPSPALPSERAAVRQLLLPTERATCGGDTRSAVVVADTSRPVRRTPERDAGRQPSSLAGGAKSPLGSASWWSAASPEAHALAVRREAGAAERSRLDVAGFIRACGWTFEHRSLAAAAGALEACLLPSGSGFHVVVDPAPTPRTRWASRFENDSARLRFRLAHELGHTIFYRPGVPPTRVGRPTEDEELFCDRFGAALLIPPSAASEAYVRGASSVVEAARMYATPIDAVLASASAGGITPYALGGRADLQDGAALAVDLIRGHVPLAGTWSQDAGLARTLATARGGRFSWLVVGTPEQWSVATAA